MSLHDALADKLRNRNAGVSGFGPGGIAAPIPEGGFSVPPPPVDFDAVNRRRIEQNVQRGQVSRSVFEPVQQDGPAPVSAASPQVIDLLRSMSSERNQANPFANDIQDLLRQLGQFQPVTQQGGGGTQFDSKIEALLRQLSQGGQIEFPDFAGLDSESSELRSLLESLQGGLGNIDVGNISEDPSARAFRIARLREKDLQLAGAAQRLSASGLSGSGQFDTEVRSIEEGVGERIAGFEGALAGRRRGERFDELATERGLQLQGAGLGLSNLQRRRGDLLAQFQSRVAQAGTQREGLLASLLGFQGQARSALSQRNTRFSQRQSSQQSLLDILRSRLGVTQGQFEGFENRRESSLSRLLQQLLASQSEQGRQGRFESDFELRKRRAKLEDARLEEELRKDSITLPSQGGGVFG